jgi:MFS family permease
VIGLVLGGVLTESLGWRSVFWINLPIGVFATFWAYSKLRELGTIGRGRIDIPGNILFAGGLTLFLAGLTLGALSQYTITYVGYMVVGLLMVAGFGYVELKVRSPLMDLKLFKIRAFTAGIVSNLLSSIARSGVSLVLTIFFQGALLLDPLTAGLWLIPFAAAFVSVGPLAGLLSDKYGARGFTTGGLIISTAGFLGLALIPRNVSYETLALLMILVGAGGGMFVAPNMSSIMTSAPVTERGIASGMSATLVTTGSLLSLSISFAVLATSIPSTVLQAVFAGLPLPPGVTPSIDLFIGPMHTIFLIMAAMSLVAVVPSALRGGGPTWLKEQKAVVREQVA